VLFSFFKKKKINTDLVKKISSKEIGLYLIKNTKRGEKKFYYWRDDSAANFFFNYINKSLFIKKYTFDYILFNGNNIINIRF
jgi:2-dehydro-3-deoxygluconokinase